MSVEPDRIARHLADGRRTTLTAPGGPRLAPDAAGIARRQRRVRWGKRLLPVGALLLLGSIALWPEIDRSMRVGRSALREAAALRASTGMMTNPRYHGLDTHGRPYTVTAESARQVSPDRVDLVRPIADILSSGRWVLISADSGVYAPHTQMLDLTGHVVLYRDDGTTMTAPDATIDVKRDVDASPDWVHIEGPFGELDARSYFMAGGGPGILQFRGPARLVLNDARQGTRAAAPGRENAR